MPKPILIVQGAQYGSEAKGHIAGYLCKARNISIAVRTGATNAGHTVYHSHNQTVPAVAHKMQQLPVGWVNANTKLVVGAGALIDPEILDREVRELEDYGVSIRNRLFIDRRAGLHVPAHAARSKASNRHHAIGATGKGCSEALIDRIRGRGSNYVTFGQSPYAKDYDVCDTEALLNHMIDEGASVLLEGTQGQLLDLYLGPYPYTTHKQTGPAQWLLEAGLSPSLPVEICSVVRTFPIRVAGNSGPMVDETSWPAVARDINLLRTLAGMSPIVAAEAVEAFEAAVRELVRKEEFEVPSGSNGLDQHRWGDADRVKYQVALSELHAAALKTLDPSTVAELLKLFEMTTVTKKLRRIGRITGMELETSSRQIRPSWIALTFMNYLFPQFWYQTPQHTERDSPSRPAEMYQFIDWVEERCNAPVELLSFGPEDRHITTPKAMGAGRNDVQRFSRI